MPTDEAKVLVLYSRKDTVFVDQLKAALTMRGVELLVNHSIFNDLAIIEQATTVVFVLSPDGVKSETLLSGLSLATNLKKRLVPIMCRKVDPDAMPEPVRSLNCVFFDDPSRFEDSVKWLIMTLAVGRKPRVQDPTEAGLSAIQDRLQVRPDHPPNADSFDENIVRSKEMYSIRRAEPLVALRQEMSYSPADEKGTDAVEFGVSHPPVVARGAPFQVEALLFRPHQRALAIARAQETYRSGRPLPFGRIGHGRARHQIEGRGGPGCLNRFSASISEASAGVRLPCGGAVG